MELSATNPDELLIKKYMHRKTSRLYDSRAELKKDLVRKHLAIFVDFEIKALPIIRLPAFGHPTKLLRLFQVN